MTREIRRRLRRKGLDARAIKVYAHLHSHCFNGPQCWPSQKLIGQRCGLSRQLTNHVCQQLRDAGVIDWDRQHKRGSKYPVNVYTLRYWSRPKIAGTVRVLRRLNRCDSAMPDTKGQQSRALTPLRDEQHTAKPAGNGHCSLSASRLKDYKRWSGDQSAGCARELRDFELRRTSMDQRRRPQHITVVPDLTCSRCQELARELEAKDEEAQRKDDVIRRYAETETKRAEELSGAYDTIRVQGKAITNLERAKTRQARESARAEQVERVIEHWKKHRPKTKASSFPPGGKNWQTIERALTLMADDEDGPVTACCEAIDGLHIAPWEAYGKRYMRAGDGRTLRNRLEHALGDETRIERCRGIARRVRGDEADRVFVLWQTARETEGAFFSVLLEKLGRRGMDDADGRFDVDGIPTDPAGMRTKEC